MAVYNSTGSGATVPSTLNLGERHLYGSSRLGILSLTADSKNLPFVTAGAAYSSNFIRGNKFYELSNHLGNVLVTVSDKKIGVDDGTYDAITGIKSNGTQDGKIDFYNADVVTANDYYPGGMDMPGRSYTSENQYRYGFNGKEKDKEGSVQYDYGFRIYDPRLVRFKSVDPLQKKFVELTPYQFASNSPIANVDLDGKESEHYTTTIIYTEVHRLEANGDITITQLPTTTTVTHDLKSDLFGFIPTNGPLGTGTLYTVQTKMNEIKEYVTNDGSIMGGGHWNDPAPNVLLVGNIYKLSKADETLMYTKINRPQYEGSLQIMIFGSGQGMYDDNTGDKPNPNAKTITVDMNEWNEIFEPILQGLDVKTPLKIERPSIGEIVSQQFEQLVDKYKDARINPGILPAAGTGYAPNSTVCSGGCLGPVHVENTPAYRTGNYGEVLDTIRKN